MSVATRVNGPSCTIDYTPSGTALTSGDVVDCGVFVGVAIGDIAVGILGALETEGIYDIAKFTGNSFALGDIVYWDQDTKTATSVLGYSEAVIGRAVAVAASGDATVRAKLLTALG